MLFRPTSARPFGVAVRLLRQEPPVEEVLQEAFPRVGCDAACRLPRDGESRDTPVPGIARAVDAFAVGLASEGGSAGLAFEGPALY